MKGTPERQAAIYHTFNVEDLIEAGHPLRPIKRMVGRALADMARAFKAAYSDVGRPGIPPETLLKALLLQCLYAIRSERELCRRLKPTSCSAGSWICSPRMTCSTTRCSRTTASGLPSKGYRSGARRGARSSCRRTGGPKERSIARVGDSGAVPAY